LTQIVSEGLDEWPDGASAAGSSTTGNIRLRGLTALLVLGGIALSGADEILVSSPFIALYKWFGFWGGWIASVLLWGLAGLAMLLSVDFIWPRVRPILERLRSFFEEHVWVVIARLPAGYRISGVALAAAPATALILWFVAPYARMTVEWFWSEPLMLVLLVVVILIAVVLLAAYEVMRKGVERFVAYVPLISQPAMRAAAKCAAAIGVMVYMGPVLCAPFLNLLGIKRRAALYLLTVIAAPCFVTIWYPIYTLGVADNVRRVFS
jgi:hypothetical protein